MEAKYQRQYESVTREVNYINGWGHPVHRIETITLPVRYEDVTKEQLSSFRNTYLRELEALNYKYYKKVCEARKDTLVPIYRDDCHIPKKVAVLIMRRLFPVVPWDEKGIFGDSPRNTLEKVFENLRWGYYDTIIYKGYKIYPRTGRVTLNGRTLQEGYLFLRKEIIEISKGRVQRWRWIELYQ